MEAIPHLTLVLVVCLTASITMQWQDCEVATQLLESILILISGGSAAVVAGNIKFVGESVKLFRHSKSFKILCLWFCQTAKSFSQSYLLFWFDFVHSVFLPISISFVALSAFSAMVVLPGSHFLLFSSHIASGKLSNQVHAQFHIICSLKSSEKE